MGLNLSPLHARIRFFKRVLHIRYKLELKKRAAYGEEKARVQGRKTARQMEFYQQMGLAGADLSVCIII